MSDADDHGNPLPEAPDHPSEAEPGRTMPRRQLVIAALVVIAVVGAGGLAWRWHSGRYVGTEVYAELSLNGCLNSLGWEDPVAGVWSTGNQPAYTQPLISEPITLRLSPVNGRPLDPARENPPGRGLDRRAVGTMRFHSREHATFTSRAGGTFEFIRPQSDITMQCAMLSGLGGNEVAPEVQVPSPTATWGTIQGYLARARTNGDPELIEGTVRLVDASGTVAEAPVGLDGYRFWAPPGTFTLVATPAGGGADCRLDPVVVNATGSTPADLICPPS